MLMARFSAVPLLFLLSTSWAAAQVASRSLTVVVVDPMDAAIVGASVSLHLQVDSASVRLATTDGRGEAVFTSLQFERVAVRVQFPGFEAHLSAPLTLRRTTVYRARMRLAGYVEEITVRRDPREIQTDCRGDAFSTVLSPEQIAALSDDPATMQRQLEQMAGPGATFRIDGFRGGRFPMKQEIARVRIVWNVFSAEFHDGGTPMVDIITRPGADRFHVRLSSAFQPRVLAAQPPLGMLGGEPSSETVAAGVGGPIVTERASFLTLVQRTGRREPPAVVAVGSPPATSGQRETAVRETVSWDVVGRFSVATGSGWAFRSGVEHRRQDGENLGIGGLDLPERAYSRRDRRSALSVSSTGTIAKWLAVDTRARYEVADALLDPVSRDPAVVVSGAARRGGAQVEGGRRLRELEIAQDVDIPWRQHAFRGGVLIERYGVASDQWANRAGTFIFRSVEALAAGKPSVFTQRTGSPNVDVATTQVGVYLQDDFRLAPGVSVSVGVRQERQRQLGASWNVSPRVGVSWSPFSDGRTTVTCAFGKYYTWTPVSMLETVARLGGRQQRELVIMDPAYPEPSGGRVAVSPVPNRYLLGNDLILPRAWQGSVSAQREVTRGLTARAVYEWAVGNKVLRGRNLNPPDPSGHRADPDWANVIQTESTARSRSSAIRLSLMGRLRGTPMTVVSNYVYARSYDDTDGPFDLPADHSRPEAEWASSSGDVRHRLALGAFLTWRARLFLSASLMASSGLPYTVTTGDDDNGDSVFNDRPSGVGRNSRRQPGSLPAQFRVAWTMPFRRSSPPTGPVPQSTAAGAQATTASGQGPRSQLYVDVQNVFNSPGWAGYVGALSSPLFGRPTAAQQARRVTFGLSFDF